MTLSSLMLLAGVVGAAVLGFLLLRRRLARPRRVEEGELCRFDSVTKLREFCMDRYRTDKVRCSSETGEFLLQVKRPGGQSFESLIVHFEGEGTYAARLPAS